MLCRPFFNVIDNNYLSYEDVKQKHDRHKSIYCMQKGIALIQYKC